MTSYALYDPINVPKPIGEGIWIVDGPEIRMSFPWLPVFSLPFPTRMTIARLSDGSLWVHSPTPISDDLANDVDTLGSVNYLVAPNLLHYWWIGDWKARYPKARTYGAPGVREKASLRFREFDVDLGEMPPPEWRGEIDLVLARGDFLTEAAFFHRASRTLVLTDMIENFEPARFSSVLLQMLVRAAGCCDPDGTMPRDLRATFFRHKEALRAAIERMVEWRPERVVIAHGRWYPGNAEAELKRAFRWVYKAAA